MKVILTGGRTEADKSAEKEATELRDKAVRVLSREFGLPSDVTSVAAERVVDCIIEAAVLTMEGRR